MAVTETSRRDFVGGAFVLRGMELLGLLGSIISLICHWASDFPWFSFVSFCVVWRRNHLSDTAFRCIIGICGVFPFALGTSFVVEGAKLVIGT